MRKFLTTIIAAAFLCSCSVQREIQAGAHMIPFYMEPMPKSLFRSKYDGEWYIVPPIGRNVASKASKSQVQSHLAEQKEKQRVMAEMRQVQQVIDLEKKRQRDEYWGNYIKSLGDNRIQNNRIGNQSVYDNYGNRVGEIRPY